jgi:ribosomal protein L14E/L6E/L27E
MIQYSIGQVVFSKCGHDKGKAYIVISKADEYLYLCDGDIRPMNKAKKKKSKHVQVTDYILEALKIKIESGTVMDADFIKELKPYKNKFLGGSRHLISAAVKEV